MAKGKPFEKIITVQRHSKNKTGIMVGNDVWMNFSKSSGLNADSTPIGKSFTVTGNESEWQGKPSYFIESVAPHGETAAITQPAVQPESKPITITAPLTASTSSGIVERLDKREASIVTQAMLKSVIESPAIPMFLGGAKSFAQVVEETVRELLGVHDKLVAERTGGSR